MLYACDVWKPTKKEGIERLESVKRRALKIAGLGGRSDYKEACKKACMNSIKDEEIQAEGRR